MYNKQDKWTRTKKVLAVIVAISLWLASMNFSYSGFNFNVSDMAWLGWILALSVTVIELVFNTDIQKLNLTLFVAGILAYLYGIYTNVLGIFATQGGTWNQLQQHPETLIFPLLVGIFVEVVPEPLFVWGIGASDRGDPLGSIFKGKEKIDDWTSVEDFPTKKISSEFIGKIPRRQDGRSDQTKLL